MAKPTGSVVVSTSGTALNEPKIGDVLTIVLTVSEQLSSYPRISFGEAKTFAVPDIVYTKNSNIEWVENTATQWTGTYTISGEDMILHNFYIDFTNATDEIGTLFYDLGFGGTGKAITPLQGITYTDISTTEAEIGTTYNSLINDAVQTVAVGGVAAGTLASTLKAMNLVQVLDAILFPDLAPTYTIPTITLTLSSGTTGVKEVGTLAAMGWTAVGNKNDAGPFTNISVLRNSSVINSNNAPTQASITAIPAQYGQNDPNNPNYSYTSTYTDNYTVAQGTISWTAQGNYNAGLPKPNNKGVLDARTPLVRNVNAPQAAGTNFASSAVTITGLYPYWYGVSNTQPTQADIAAAVQAGTSFGTVTSAPQKTVSDASGTININFNASGQYLWFAHWSTYTTKTIWYVTALNTGSIGGGSNLFGTAVTQNLTSPNAYWSTIPYKVYIGNYPTSSDSGNPTMQLRNS